MMLLTRLSMLLILELALHPFFIILVFFPVYTVMPTTHSVFFSFVPRRSKFLWLSSLYAFTSLVFRLIFPTNLLMSALGFSQ